MSYRRIKYTDRLDWLAKRRTGIGGSDISAVVNLNPFRGRFSLWLDKTGQIKDEPENDYMFWGKKLEDTIADVFAEKHPGLRVVKCNDILQHPTESWALYNPDRLLYKGGELGILEIKTSNAYAKNYTETDYPDAPYLQLLHGFFVTGAKWGWLVALVGGNQYFEYYIERDNDVINMIEAQAKDFWFENVITKKEPPADGSSQTTDLIKDRFPQAIESKSLELEGLTEIAEKLTISKGLAKEYKDQVTMYENQIKQLLGDAEAGESERAFASWKNYERIAFDSKRLQEENPDLYNQYLKPTPYRKFAVKIKE